jgi:hypothetical protein
LTWWVHPDIPDWYNEVSFWASKEALNDWHMDTYHKHAKQWAANGAIMEDIITNFELVGTRLLRICPTCGTLQDKPYELAQEQRVLREPCPNCGFIFPVATETEPSTAVFKDVQLGPAPFGESAALGEANGSVPESSAGPVVSGSRI